MPVKQITVVKNKRLAHTSRSAIQSKLSADKRLAHNARSIQSKLSAHSAIQSKLLALKYLRECLQLI